MSSEALHSLHDPDGVPPEIIGLTAFSAFMLAGLVAVLLWTGTLAGLIGAAVIAILGVPAISAALSRRSKQLRGGGR